jgi:hypothetical protein
MGETIDTEDARRAAAATSRMLGQLEGTRRKPASNVIVLALKRKLATPRPPAKAIEAAE